MMTWSRFDFKKNWIKVFLLFWCFQSGLESIVFALPEKNWITHFQKEALPFFCSSELLYFKGVSGVPIAYRQWIQKNTRGTLIIHPGRATYLTRYAELITDLKSLQLNWVIMMPRGQGESGRILKDPETQFVEHFEDYVKDLETFLSEIGQAFPKPWFLMGESMGGAVNALYLEKHPHDFDRALFVVPMFEINTAPYPSAIVLGLTWIASFLGFGQHYAFGQGPLSLTLPFQEDPQKPARWNWRERYLREHPEIRMGGVSFQWVQESFQAMKQIKQKSQTLLTRSLILHAEKDQTVLPEGIQEVSKYARRVEVAILPGATHDIFFQEDKIRGLFIEKIFDFFR